MKGVFVYIIFAEIVLWFIRKMERNKLGSQPRPTPLNGALSISSVWLRNMGANVFVATFERFRLMLTWLITEPTYVPDRRPFPLVKHQLNCDPPHM